MYAASCKERRATRYFLYIVPLPQRTLTDCKKVNRIDRGTVQSQRHGHRRGVQYSNAANMGIGINAASSCYDRGNT